MSLVRNAEALRWRGCYPLLPLLVEYRNVLRAGPAAVVKSAVTHLRALMEVCVAVDKRPEKAYRKLAMLHKELARKLLELEAHLKDHDHQMSRDFGNSCFDLTTHISLAKMQLYQLL